MSGKKSRELTREFMSRHIKQQEASGLSVKAYCQSEGISKSRYYYWRRQLTDEQSRDGFIPLDLPSLDSSAREIEVILPGDITLRIRY